MNPIESALSLSLPPDYKQFVATYGENGFEYFFRIDLWVFWGPEEAISQTLKLRKSKAIGPGDFAFATNSEQQVLFYKRESGSLSHKIYHLDELKDWMFYAYSMSEFVNFEKTEQLIREIETKGFENQDLSEIMDCPGSLFNYALQLKVSSFDEDAPLGKNQKALELFLLAADQKHPGAANQLASHYYFSEETDVEKVLEWREKAVEYGSVEDIYELADFIADEKPELIDKAIDLLKSLLDTYWYKSRASLKLSRIFMQGTGGRLDYEQGIKYARMSADQDNYNGLSDLAFFYFKGMGVEKDLHKALELLKKADRIAASKGVGGVFSDRIKAVEMEMNKK